MKHDSLSVLLRWKLAGVASHELAVMFYLHLSSELAPILSHCPNTMRADRDDLLHLGLPQRGNIRFRKLSEHQVIAKPPGRITGAALFFQNPERSIQVLHDSRKRSDDFTPTR